MEISDRIKLLRKNHLHLTQEEFGKRLGVGRGVIANIEYDALRRPEQKEPLYKLICKEFNISYAWLTEGIEPMEAEIDFSLQAKVNDILYGEDPFARGIFSAFAKLDKNEWELLKKIIDDIKKETDI